MKVGYGLWVMGFVFSFQRTINLMKSLELMPWVWVKLLYPFVRFSCS